MTTKIRKLIFYALIALFIILTLFIIPYSNGLRFNLNTLSFERLGGLYLNVEPTEAKIQVDKLNFEIKPSLIKSGLLIANLFPKTYHVSIQKDGYQTWNKNLTVRPSLVTEIYPITLIPEKAKEELLGADIKDLFLNTNYLAIKDTNNKLRINGKIIKGTAFLSWLTGERLALVYDENSKNYLVINPAQNNSALNINLLFENLKYQKMIGDNGSIKKVTAHPFDKNKLIINTNKNIYVLDFYKPSIESIASHIYDQGEEIIDRSYDLLGANGEELFLTDPQHFYSYHLNKNEGGLLLALDQEKIISLEVSSNNQFLAFSKNNKLILLDRSKNEDQLTDLGITDPSYFKFSPDSKKLAVAFGDDKIKVFFIGNDYDLFNKVPMASSYFDLGQLDPNHPIIWRNDSYYLFIRSKTDLKFLEINDAPPVNIKTIDADIDNYFYSRQENIIYFIRNNSLYRILN